MPILFYLRYARRALQRGGQRTLLALFCVAIGVMTIVALQLVGLSVRETITHEIQAQNGGDIALRSRLGNFTPADLQFFADQQAAGLITAYAPEFETQTNVRSASGQIGLVGVRAVAIDRFPLYGKLDYLAPTGGGQLAELLKPAKTVVVSDGLARQFNLAVGDVLTFFTPLGLGSTFQARVVAIVTADSLGIANPLLAGQALVNLGAAPTIWGKTEYQRVTARTVDARAAAEVKQRAQARFPLVDARTADDLLRRNLRTSEDVMRFLSAVGLLALLIGGIGIANTTQVALSRRTLEIAMLKTMGYSARQIIQLFSAEALLLGLLGGLPGVLLGIGVSGLLLALARPVVPFLLIWTVDPGTLVGGLAIAAATTLIFALLPIVRASRVRPIAVLREGGGQAALGRLLSAGLLAVLTGLFLLLAGFILNDFGLAVRLVGITVVALVGLSFLLGLLAVGVAHLPSLGRLNVRFALRNIGRQRARSATTLLALLVGVFTVTLILVLGQNVRGTLQQEIGQRLDYNVVAFSPTQDDSELAAAVKVLPSLERYTLSNGTTVRPTQINREDITPRLRALSGNQREFVLNLTQGIEGYRLQQLVPDLEMTAGRNLTPADEGLARVVLDEAIAGLLKVKVGDRLTLEGDDKTSYEMAVIGLYRRPDLQPSLTAIKGSYSLVDRIGGPRSRTAYWLRIKPGQLEPTVAELQRAAPNALVFNVSAFLSLVSKLLDQVIVVLTVISSLSLVAGIIIIANSVTLATIERRKEMGTLKAVGADRWRVLAILLIEYALIGLLGGILGTLLAAGTLTVLAQTLFDFSATVDVVLLLEMIGLAVVVALAAASLAAWRAARLRPLTVLRYE